jgi:hypothetical protein
MVLKTLEAMGPLHGYGIARRIEQVSGNSLVMKQGTIYPALLRHIRAINPPRSSFSGGLRQIPCAPYSNVQVVPFLSLEQPRQPLLQARLLR